MPSIASDQFMPRTGFPVLLVDLNGRLGVRKEFRSYGRFVQEIEALLDLDARGCPVPQIMNVDWYAHALTITLCRGGLCVRCSRNGRASATEPWKALIALDRKERISTRPRIVRRVLSDWQISRIAAGLATL